MRIVHISTALSWRGGEQQLAYLLEELHKKDLQQWVFCFKNSEIEKYCITHQIGFVSTSRSSAFHPVLLYKLAHFCKQNKIQIIHAHDAHAHTMAVLSAALFQNKAKIVLSRKVDFPIKSNFFSHYKYNHPSIQKIICVSLKIKEILAPDIKNKKILTCIYDGIDSSKFRYPASGILRQQYAIDKAEIIIGNVAALADHKDYFTFVDVAKILLDKKVKAKFLIVGDGPDRAKIASYISELKLQNEIILCGFRKDITQILPEFDVFLFTSKTEGLGSSILDAYACHVPVVATRAGGIPEIVKDEETGLLAAPKDADLLANQVMRLIQDNVLKTKLIANADSWVQHFSKEKNAALCYAVYKEILA